jgi:uncharacterized protein (TIGR03437 family)
MGYGLYKSSDNGVSWTKLSVPVATGAKPTDLQMDPQSGNTLYAAFLGQGIFKTTDGGTTWCPLNPGIPLPARCAAATGLPNPTTTTFDWVQTAVFHPSSASPATLYATFSNCPDPIGNGASFTGDCNPSLFKSPDGGATWTLQNPSAPPVYSRYTHALAIHPTDPTQVFVGGIGLFQSSDSGVSFDPIGSEIHPDHHALVFPDPGNPDRIYDTNDGGFVFTNDGGATWISGNSHLQITAFQSVSSSPLTGRIIGGSQDNGTQIWLGVPSWEHIDDGDSSSTVMSLDNVLNMYDNYFEACPRRSTTGGVLNSFDLITFGINTYFDCYTGGPFAGLDPAAVYPPFVQDPTSPHPLYFGTNRLYQTTNDGTDWTPVSPALGETGTFYPDIGRNNVITAIAVAPSNPNRIYIGYYDGQIWVTDGACTAASCWRAAGGSSHGAPDAIVTRIAVHPTNPNMAYATYSGFGIGAHVYRTSNGGMSWIPANGALPGVTPLPDVPANTISIEPSAPNNLWLGTDGAVMNGVKGSVFKSPDGGLTWAPFSSGLPNSPVYEISIDESHGRIYAATHGRGIYVITQPYLSNYEGWVLGGIWDIPVYGGGFTGLAPQTCTMSLIRANGTVCASGSTDAMGGTIQIDSSGTLVTSNGSFYNGSPVAWGCFNGKCLNGTDISSCNQPGNVISTVTVTCDGVVGVDKVLNCPQEFDPPSATLGFSGTSPSPVSASQAAVYRKSAKAARAPGSFDVIATVQAGDGTTRALCSADVPFQRGEEAASIISRSRDALNNNPACSARTVTAIARGLPPATGTRAEDSPGGDPRLFISAPGINGSQLLPGLHTGPGQSGGSCFAVNGLGVPVLNSITITRITLETLAGGAASGGITLTETTDLGNCTVSIPTSVGQSAAQIATALAGALHVPGIPGPNRLCPSNKNVRDITADGPSIVAVAARGLNVCVQDPGVGFAVLPEELPLGSIVLNHPVRVLSFVANPETIVAGDSATLTWTTENATDVTITNVGPVALNGTVTVKPLVDTIYTINALAMTGDANAFVLVKVIQVPSISVNGVVNAASFAGGPISPGELVTIFGEGIGPATGQTLQLDASGLVTTSLGDVRVLFDGIPAPMVYAQSTQTTVVVPYELTGKTQTQMTLEYKGRPSNSLTLPVAATSPGLFTIPGSGGQGTILNQNGSVNSPANPADKGSVISLFGTGAGQTNPPGVDGKPAVPPFPKPVASVSVKIGGMDAEVLYAAAAPTLVAGVIQVNARIPAGVSSGDVPVELTIGGTSSQDVTVAVK